MDSLDAPYASPKAQVPLWRWTSRLLAGLLVVSCSAACLVVAFFVGELAGFERAYSNQSRRLRTRVEAVMQTLPGDYSSITIEKTSNGGVYLSGDLSPQELQDLKQAIQVHLGGELAEDMTGGIDIAVGVGRQIDVQPKSE